MASSFFARRGIFAFLGGKRYIMVSNVLLEKVEFSAWNREFSKTLNTFQLHSICGKRQNILAKRIILILFFFKK